MLPDVLALIVMIVGKGDVLLDDLSGHTFGAHLAVLQPDSPITEALHIGKIVRHKENRRAGFLDFEDALDAFLWNTGRRP